ncbi:hypothetical protein ACVWZ6_001079 [Bradyrhizobium sp. GM6.1]
MTSRSARAAGRCAPRQAAIGRAVDQRRGACEDRNRQERHAPQADQRRRLCQRQRLGQRIAERVPGKAGQRMTPQPFRDGEACRERKHARRVLGPEQAGERKAHCREDRQIGRQAQHGERRQPGEYIGVDEEGVADPVEAGHEIAEAEPVAGKRRGGDAAISSGAGAVDQPDQHREV